MYWLKCTINWLGTNAIWLSVVATLLAAVATFLAVFVALFKDSFWNWLRRPKLKIEFNFEPPDCQLEFSDHIEQRTGISTRIYMMYVRFRVINEGKTAARNVEVCASKLSINNTQNNDSNVRNFIPMYLKWSHTNTITMHAIPVEMGKTCDLGKIIDPNTRGLGINEDVPHIFDSQKTIFSFEVEPKPNSCPHLIEDGNYILELLIGADNCKPIKAMFRIGFDGTWMANGLEMIEKSHIRVEKI